MALEAAFNHIVIFLGYGYKSMFPGIISLTSYELENTSAVPLT